MASAPSSPWHRDRAGVLRFVGGTLLVMVCAAAACSLDSSGLDPGNQFADGGGGQGNGGGSSAGGYGGSLTISAGGGSVASTTGTAGGEGGAGGAGGGSGGGGGEFVCEGDGVFEDPVTDHCYRHIESGENWLNAEAKCKLWGGQTATLAAISSLPEWTVILAVLGPSHDIWLGGRNFPGDVVDDYVWSNNEPWGFAPDGMLPVNDPTKPCIKLKNVDLQPKACGESHEYLCERH
jgi:hypothetical protein